MGEKFKVALFYYTQTGQALAIARKVCEPLAAAGLQIIVKEIQPEEPYPFPWSCNAFLQVFPESRLAIPCKLKPFILDDIQDADLVIVAGQSWYLSHSLPLHGFYQSEEIRSYLKGRNILTIDGCRNMWIMKQLKTREYIHGIEANYVGSVVLQDMTQNLVSVITIARWLVFNKKEATSLLPAAGVSSADIDQSTRFGEVLLDTLQKNSFDLLQQKLMDEGAIKFIPSLYFIEKNGFRLWGVWARFIMKVAPTPGPKRKPYLNIFMYYLFFVLYVVSPFGLLFFYLTYPFRYKSLKRASYEMCYELGWNNNRTVQ